MRACLCAKTETKSAQTALEVLIDTYQKSERHIFVPVCSLLFQHLRGSAHCRPVASPIHVLQEFANALILTRTAVLGY